MIRLLPSPRPLRAFTLMEVMISVVAFAIILSAIGAVFYGAVRLRNRTVQELESLLPLQRTLRVLKRDLANIVNPGGTLSGSLQSSATAGLGGTTASAASGTIQMPINVPGSPVPISPQFYTATGRLDDLASWSEIQKVTYLLADPTNRVDGRDLYRSVSRNLLPPNLEDPTGEWLMGGVEQILFTYYDGTQWLDTWDSTTTTTTTSSNTLPKAIKVEILLAAARTNRLAATPIELVVPLETEALTNDVSSIQAAGPDAAGSGGTSTDGQPSGGGTQPPSNNPPTGGGGRG